MLILDEVMSLIPQLGQKITYEERMNINQEILFGLISRVRKLVCMDANLSLDMVEFIRRIRGEQRSFIIIKKELWYEAPKN